MAEQTQVLSPAVGGYDVVAYQDGTATPGDAAFNVTYNGTLYFFSSPENKTRFEADPEKYIPAYGGYCATAMSEGKTFGADPTNFILKDGRVFLFYRGVGGDTKTQWEAEEADRLPQADTYWNDGTYNQHN